MAAAATFTPAAEYPPPAQRALIMFSLIMATFMTAVAGTIANVVLPQIRASVGASQDEITWVLTSYILSTVVATPLTGWAADRFGRRTIMLIAISGFGVTAVLCGLVTNIYEMVLLRGLEGVFGAMFMPLSQSIMLDINPPEEHPKAMAMWGMGTMLGPISGPVIGGWVSDNLSWRACFILNLPFVIIAFLLLAAAVPKTPPIRSKKLDVFGYLSVTAGFVALQFMLDRGPSKDWFVSPEIWIELGVALLGFYLFFVHTFTSKKRTIFDRAVLLDFNFMMAAVMGLLLGMLMMAGMSFLPIMLQTLFGYTVLKTGFAQIPRTIGMFCSMWLVGRIANKVDGRVIVISGLALTAFAYHMMTGFSPDMGDELVMESGFLQGLGLGLCMVPMTTLAFQTITPAMRTDAAALNALVRSIGGSVGISIVSAVQMMSIKVASSTMTEHVTPDNPGVMANWAGINLATPEGVTVAQGLIGRQAAMLGYIDGFQLLVYVAFAAVPIVLMLKGNRPVAGAHTRNGPTQKALAAEQESFHV